MKTKKERIKKLSELALTMYLSDSDYLDPKLDPKFKAAYKRIWYYAEKELQKNFRKGVSEDDKAEVDKIMRKFLRDTGWNRRGKKINALTFASFLADITDRYSPGIPFALNLLSEHLEEEPGGKQLCYNAGKTAAEKWKKIFDHEKK